MAIPNAARIAAIALLLSAAGAVQAQPAADAAAQAVVAFMNILQHELVAETEQTQRMDAPALAAALLDELLDREVLAGDIASAMNEHVGNQTVDRGAFILFLLDLLNWTDAYDNRDLAEAEDDLESRYCGLEVPLGTPSRAGSGQLLASGDVGAVVRDFLDRFDCIVPGLRDRYRLPVE